MGLWNKMKTSWGHTARQIKLYSTCVTSREDRTLTQLTSSMKEKEGEEEDNILLMLNMSKLQIQWTVTNTGYLASPDSLKKLLSFVSCWVRRNSTNIVKRCLWLILNYVGLLVYLADVTLSSVFVCVEQGVCLSQLGSCLFAYRVRKWDLIRSGHSDAS